MANVLAYYSVLLLTRVKCFVSEARDVPVFQRRRRNKKITEIEIEMFDLTKRVLKINFLPKPEKYLRRL